MEEAALDALHQGLIDKELPKDGVARRELGNIRKWWFRACDSVNYKIESPVLGGEARFALDWCQRLAEQIVLRERASRLELPLADNLEGTAFWVWERFNNLESGLRSNGLPKRENDC